MTLKKGKKLRANLPNHTIKECNHKINDEYIHKSPNAKENISEIKMFNKDGLRQIIVPSHDIRSSPGIWSEEKYEHLKKQSRVFTKQDRLAIIEEAKDKQNRLFVESFKRQEKMENTKQDQRALAGSKLYNEEAAAAARSMYVLQRAIDLRQEQEDDIKYANGVILLAKCVDMRKKQLLEKELMKKEEQEEEERLEMMMEQQRQRLIKTENAKEEKRKQLNRDAFKSIVEQIEEHEYNKILENEQKKEENRLIQKKIAQMKAEDKEELRQKQLEQLKTRETLKKANEDLLRIKDVQKEEQRIADCRVQEFMRAKAERDAEHQKLLAEQKMERDRKIAILQALQEKAQGEQSAADELKAQKVQRQFERERKEMERLAELKRNKVIKDLKNGRKLQIEENKKAKDLEQQYEQNLMNKTAKVQYDLYEDDVKRDRLRKAAAMKYRKELLEQIHFHEIDRIHKIRQKFEEGFSLRHEHEAHEIGIKNTLNRKLQRLHEKNVPECVIKDIERTLKI